MKDGAPPHINNDVKTLLRNTFGDRVIGRYFPTSWTCRLKHMNAEFWLWGYFRERVFVSRPSTLEKLKQSIIRNVSPADDRCH